MTRHSGVVSEEARFMEVPLAPSDVLVGKDVLELVTTAMYVDPITIYREYVQNAADAIDEARSSGVLAPAEPGQVNIDVEPTSRSVRIRDNGTGVPWLRFVHCLTRLGASSKRGTPARGFRGVGRLAGLGYAQELIFRSRVAGEEPVSELRWNCRLLKAELRNAASSDDVSELIRSIVTASRVELEGYPERFFEVELRGMVRLRSDKLLNPTAIAEYLAQVAPVPFAPDFRFGAEITNSLSGSVTLGQLQLFVSGASGPVFRPHRDGFAVDGSRIAPFESIEIVEIPGVDGQVAAIGWILHHGYEGAVPSGSLVRGLRLRCGNLQVGDHALLEEFFPEPRFNAWSVGEIHVLDRRIVPNGRRDNFEQDAHLNNLLNHLTPVARSIAKRCRVSSRQRHLLRQFAIEEANARERLAIVAQGVLTPTERNSSAGSIQQGIARMEKIIRADELADCEHPQLEASVTAVRAELGQLITEPFRFAPLGHLPVAKRRMYEHLFELVYECSTNRVAAKSLVDRILVKLQSADNLS